MAANTPLPHSMAQNTPPCACHTLNPAAVFSSRPAAAADAHDNGEVTILAKLPPPCAGPTSYPAGLSSSRPGGADANGDGEATIIDDLLANMLPAADYAEHEPNSALVAAAVELEAFSSPTLAHKSACMPPSVSNDAIIIDGFLASLIAEVPPPMASNATSALLLPPASQHSSPASITEHDEATSLRTCSAAACLWLSATPVAEHDNCEHDNCLYAMHAHKPQAAQQACLPVVADDSVKLFSAANDEGNETPTLSTDAANLAKIASNISAEADAVANVPALMIFRTDEQLLLQAKLSEVIHPSQRPCNFPDAALEDSRFTVPSHVPSEVHPTTVSMHTYATDNLSILNEAEDIPIPPKGSLSDPRTATLFQVFFFNYLDGWLILSSHLEPLLVIQLLLSTLSKTTTSSTSSPDHPMPYTGLTQVPSCKLDQPTAADLIAAIQLAYVSHPYSLVSGCEMCNISLHSLPFDPGGAVIHDTPQIHSRAKQQNPQAVYLAIQLVIPISAVLLCQLTNQLLNQVYNQLYPQQTVSSRLTYNLQAGFMLSIRLRGRICGVQALETTHDADLMKSFKARPKHRSELLIFFILKSTIDPG